MASLLYGIWIESYSPKADPATHLVAVQTIWALDLIYDEMDYDYFEDQPKIWMGYGNRTVINAYEGCNGINVFIIFIAFIVAYKGSLKESVLFIGLGLILLHISNITRISLLFYVADSFPQYMYFTHKYLFTASIYGLVFILWFVWIKRVNNKVKTERSEN